MKKYKWVLIGRKWDLTNGVTWEVGEYLYQDTAQKDAGAWILSGHYTDVTLCEAKENYISKAEAVPIK